jgi:hypothetical protein
MVLPTTVKSESHQRVLPKRYIRFLLVLASCALVLFFFDPHHALEGGGIHGNVNSPRYPNIPYPKIQLTSPNKTSDLPPLYEEYRIYEDRVTQWNLNNYGKAGDRYIYVANRGIGAGWGNIMQDMVFNTLLASGSGRG